jgi:hypothetical protein
MNTWRLRLAVGAALGLVAVLTPVDPAAAASGQRAGVNCARDAAICTEVFDSEAVFGEGVYVGHDEPSALFYSARPGSGNDNTYLLRLPKDPPVHPNGTDSGGTFNFQLHPAFWFGMAMCDTQSSPNFTNTCTPDSDGNIFDSTDPNSPTYIGKHPGTAFMEMQFYPPGWMQWPAALFNPGGSSCDTTRWCAAMNIDSLSRNENTLVPNNAACVNNPFIGLEPINFAFITKDGRSQAPASPVNSTLATWTPDPNRDLFMSSGDLLSVRLHDTGAGFRVDIHDLTSHQSGSMTASIANGFGQVNYRPNDTTCTGTPYAFHPMYSTTSERTRVIWAAHSYNVAFSDEIGHFEYCAKVDTSAGTCTVPAGNDAGSPDDPANPNFDDFGCFAASQLPPGAVQVTGCTGSDADFDGPEYFDNWPGTLTDVALDRQLHAQPITFTSPTSRGHGFERVAFETDLPRIEPTCSRLTGAGCVNPPPGTAFYPFYTTGGTEDRCVWQLGGAHIPGTQETFGGTSTTAYGSLLTLAYPGGPNFTPRFRINDFRNVLPNNPCASGEGGGGD